MENPEETVAAIVNFVPSLDLKNMEKS
jgi:hypothetical protein